MVSRGRKILRMKELCNVGHIQDLIEKTLRVLSQELRFEGLIPEHLRNHFHPVVGVVISEHEMIGNIIG